MSEWNFNVAISGIYLSPFTFARDPFVPCEARKAHFWKVGIAGSAGPKVAPLAEGSGGSMKK